MHFLVFWIFASAQACIDRLYTYIYILYCVFYCIFNMSSHQSSKDKPCALKCHDTHNFCPTCREAGKGDDSCVTFISPCNICASFTEEQMTKITHRKRYVKKEKSDTNKDEEMELLGDQEVESFSGSHADLESAADHLFTSPPHPQPLDFEALSSKTPSKSVPPTPGTGLQQKIESKLEQSLGSRFDIQLEQKMGIFQASMLEASIQKPSQVEVDQISASASKPGPSNSVHLDSSPLRPQPSHSVKSMEVDYGPSLPPRLGPDPSRVKDTSDLHLDAVKEHSRLHSAKDKKHSHSHKQHDIDLSSASDQYSYQTDDPRPVSRPKKYADNPNINPGPDMYPLLQRRISPL